MDRGKGGMGSRKSDGGGEKGKKRGGQAALKYEGRARMAHAEPGSEDLIQPISSIRPRPRDAAD
ncbi:hypothetical protein ACRQ5Q_30840 [Bradyrhizobium sp. PMVTL-01]|uniref:hypothetical protein n=1 Tax=Bradyrhizobium sp. PMVTL-01 TaxID=3434999 RepID=UPI003F6EB52A